MSEETKTNISVDVAVEEYRKWELKNFAADRAYRDLHTAVLFLASNISDEEERAAALRSYYERTEAIRAEFEKKREREGL